MCVKWWTLREAHATSMNVKEHSKIALVYFTTADDTAGWLAVIEWNICNSNYTHNYFFYRHCHDFFTIFFLLSALFPLNGNKNTQWALLISTALHSNRNIYFSRMHLECENSLQWPRLLNFLKNCCHFYFSTKSTSWRWSELIL